MPLCDRNPLLQFCFSFDVVMCIVLNEALHCDDRFLPDAPLNTLYTMPIQMGATEHGPSHTASAIHGMCFQMGPL